MSDPRFCLVCYKAGMGCKCKEPKSFHYSNKLRVPDTKNKERFRLFLDSCPQFVNCVPEEYKADFLALLKHVKYFETTINGHDWTNIDKNGNHILTRDEQYKLACEEDSKTYLPFWEGLLKIVKNGEDDLALRLKKHYKKQIELCKEGVYRQPSCQGLTREECALRNQNIRAYWDDNGIEEPTVYCGKGSTVLGS